MCAYNADKFIDKALDSLKAQSFKDFEVILIDDGSTDRTVQLVQQYIEKKELDIRYYYQENCGLTKSLNRAISLVEGQYIARMDADDISLPNRLERSLAYLEANCLDFMCAKSEMFDEHGVKGYFPSFVSHNKKSFSAGYLKFGNSYTHGTFFGKKEVFEELGYNERYRTAQDYDFLCRLAKSGKYNAAFLNEVLYRLRVDAESSGRSANSNQVNNAIEIAFEHFGSARYLIPASGYLKKRILSVFKRIIYS